MSGHNQSFLVFPDGTCEDVTGECYAMLRELAASGKLDAAEARELLLALSGRPLPPLRIRPLTAAEVGG